MLIHSKQKQLQRNDSCNLCLKIRSKKKQLRELSLQFVSQDSVKKEATSGIIPAICVSRFGQKRSSFRSYSCNLCLKIQSKKKQLQELSLQFVSQDSVKKEATSGVIPAIYVSNPTSFIIPDNRTLKLFEVFVLPSSDKCGAMLRDPKTFEYTFLLLVSLPVNFLSSSPGFII